MFVTPASTTNSLTVNLYCSLRSSACAVLPPQYYNKWRESVSSDQFISSSQRKHLFWDLLSPNNVCLCVTSLWGPKPSSETMDKLGYNLYNYCNWDRNRELQDKLLKYLKISTPILVQNLNLLANALVKVTGLRGEPCLDSKYKLTLQ